MSAGVQERAVRIRRTNPYEALTFTRGDGCRVSDASGREYLDLLSGTWCNVLGHAHPRLREAVSAQVSTLTHLGASFLSREIEEALAKLSVPTRVVLPPFRLALLAMALSACVTPAGPALPPEAPMQQQASARPAVLAVVVPRNVTAQPDVRAELAKLVATIPRGSHYGTVTAVQLAREAGSRPFLLDVREPAELEADGYVEGSVSIPLSRLVANLATLPARDQPIVVYCASGHRGAMAMTALRLLGYTDVRNLAFGFGAWRKAGLPVVEGSPPAESGVGTAPVIESPALHRLLGEAFSHLPDDFHAITVGRLHADLSAGKRLVLVDVRRPEQYDRDGRIAGAVSVPFELLFDSLDRLPSRDTCTVVYCASGNRSSVAVMGLRLLGYTRASSLDGGVEAWKAAGLPLVGARSRGTQ